MNKDHHHTKQDIKTRTSWQGDWRRMSLKRRIGELNRRIIEQMPTWLRRSCKPFCFVSFLKSTGTLLVHPINQNPPASGSNCTCLNPLATVLGSTWWFCWWSQTVPSSSWRSGHTHLSLLSWFSPVFPSEIPTTKAGNFLNLSPFEMMSQASYSKGSRRYR